MKEKLKKIVSFIANPRLLLCWGIAWILTNGWSYLFLGIGTWLDIPWMKAVGGGYIAFLWLPISPEKIVTTAIALFLLKRLFPNDQKTLAVLTSAYKKTKEALKKRKEEKETDNLQ